MPGINSRRVFINQNRDRVKNPTEMYAFSALRLGRMRNKQRDKHYEVAAVEASSVINAARHPVHTHTHTRARAHACTRGCERRERERENADPRARFLPRIYEDRQDLPASKNIPQPGRIPINFDSTILYRYILLLRVPSLRRTEKRLFGRLSTDYIFSLYTYIYIYAMEVCFRTKTKRRSVY